MVEPSSILCDHELRNALPHRWQRSSLHGRFWTQKCELHIHSLSTTTHLYRFRHSHGGTGCGLAHKRFRSSLASYSSPSPTRLLTSPAIKCFL